MTSQSKPISSLFALALVLIIPNFTLRTTRAQVDQAKPAAATTEKNKEVEQRQELEKKTLTLLNDTAAATWGLKLPENRLFVMAGAADLLWPFDEKRARTVYWDALNSMQLIAPAVRNTGQTLSKTEQEKAVQSYLSFFQFRQRLLRQAAKRDAQLALEMLRATRQASPRQFAEFPLPDDLQLEQEIATLIAARDPAQALQIARQSLAKGLTFEVLNLLHQLSQKDTEKASEFTGEIIAKVRTVNVATDFRAAAIAVHLLLASRTNDVREQAQLGAIATAKGLILNQEQKRELVEILTNGALNASAGGNLLVQLRQVMPEVEHFFPERRAAIERKLAAFKRSAIELQRSQYDSNVMVANGSLEEVVRMAGAADSASSLMLYQHAAVMAVAQGKADWFRDVVSKDIRDDGDRATVTDVVDVQEIAVAVHRKQLDRLQKLLPRIHRREARARALAELAVMLKEKGEDNAAATMLDEAATLIKTDIKDERETEALLTLLCAYAVVDPPKAFALADRTIDRANSQISLLMLFDRVVKSGAVKKNEIILEHPGLMPLDLMLFRYGKGVAALAKADFNRTRALAERFDRNELRVMAQLLILKALLQPLTLSNSPASP